MLPGHLSSLLPGTVCISVLPSTEPEKPGSGVHTSQHMLSSRDAFLLCSAAELCSDDGANGGLNEEPVFIM